MRARKGNKAAAEIWRQRRRAPDGVWRGVAVDAALALEATHADSEEIRDVLSYVTRPGNNGLETALGEAILARVSEAEGKHEEAARYAKSLEKRFAKADKGVAETVAKIK